MRRPGAWLALLAALAALAVGLAGCGGQTGAGGSTSTVRAVNGGARKAARHRRAGRQRHRAARRQAVRLGRPELAFSAASNQVVQPQPAPGACRALGQGPYSRPDPRCTPGALNPAVRQSTIDRTICVTGWTATVRPPEPITESEKRASLAAYGDSGPLGDYEYDHLVPLELGGATNDPRNLWPEPGASPNPKDAVELDLHDRVCSGEMSLARAQREIAQNWVRLAHRGSGSGGGNASAGGVCSVHAAFNPTYGDYDVYVRSNQPDETVTVTGDGHTRSWHTSADGAADVYFPGGRAAAGQPVTASVGSARCTGRL